MPVFKRRLLGDLCRCAERALLHYLIDPMISPQYGETMKFVAFITDDWTVDRIIDHLKLTFVAEKQPPSHVFEEVALMAAEERTDYL